MEAHGAAEGRPAGPVLVDGNHRELLRRPLEQRVVVVLHVGRRAEPERSRCRSRTGLARSETSNSDSWVPRRRPSSWRPGRCRAAGHHRRDAGRRSSRSIFSSPATRGSAGSERSIAVKRVHLAEGDHVALVVEEAHGVDALSLAEPAHAAELGERAAALRRAWSRSSGSRSRGRPAHQIGESVLATRSTPSRSDIENWLSR